METGPYQWIRHPIYMAYIMNYIGGGLLSSNLILTIVPVTMFAILVAIRIGKEEAVMKERFGQKYIEYMKRTGRLVPQIKTINLLQEIKYDLNFIKSHSLQPKWYKFLKVFILVGFLVGYWRLFGFTKTKVFFAIFIFLSLFVHLLYRAKTNKFRRSWLDFVVVEEENEIKAKSIGKFYYMAIVLNASIAVFISQMFPLE